MFINYLLVNYIRNSKNQKLKSFFFEDNFNNNNLSLNEIKSNNQEEFFIYLSKSKINLINPKNKIFYKENILKTLKNYNILVKFLNQIKNLRQTNFNKESNEHKKMLFDIWVKLKGNSEINLIDKKWMEIGFQGNDPSTDFRGAGILALYNLFDFVINRTNISERVYKDASDKVKWYFFVCCGINITGALINFYENFYLEDVVLRDFNGENLFDIFNKQYEALFDGFNTYWNDLKIFDFMRFNTEFIKFINKEGIILLKDIKHF